MTDSNDASEPVAPKPAYIRAASGPPVLYANLAGILAAGDPESGIDLLPQVEVFSRLLTALDGQLKHPGGAERKPSFFTRLADRPHNQFPDDYGIEAVLVLGDTRFIIRFSRRRAMCVMSATAQPVGETSRALPFVRASWHLGDKHQCRQGKQVLACRNSWHLSSDGTDEAALLDNGHIVALMAAQIAPRFRA